MWMEGGEKREDKRDGRKRGRESEGERWLVDVDNEEEGYLLPNLSLENNLLTF